ncbi:hypothetical protein [Streptomyces noursei]|uniref:Protein kinase domain-containing protein n=1 Tax=Streptomyces noursei TaxID=1971 RepID=A0A401RAB0_STRNR|nr:hypothetical protein [Streptomyces noursei]UWS75249.1 hypothetical protein N1H47_30870 [Streptomyces noursei]GCB94530.1 hypothetical protein SALB_07330 [Streptomyces noursei]
MTSSIASGLKASLRTPFAATILANRLAGSPAIWRLCRSEPSTHLWQVGGPQSSVAVKVAAGERAALTLVRETENLRAMPAGNLRSLGAGSDLRPTDPIAWQITPWALGLTTWEAFRLLREGDQEGREQARAVAIETCRAVGRLHTAGWLHGTLDPHHVVHTRERSRVRLLSCAWATRAGRRTSPGYGGGLVHLLSPELANAIDRSRGNGLLLSRPAEVYTLAAGLWWAVTGTWPLAYDDFRGVGFDPQTKSRPHLLRIIASGEVPRADPAVHDWPEFLEPLAGAMSPSLSRRPTAHQLADWIESIPL